MLETVAPKAPKAIRTLSSNTCVKQTTRQLQSLPAVLGLPLFMQTQSNSQKQKRLAGAMPDQKEVLVVTHAILLMSMEISLFQMEGNF
ncbi:hypothetical protein ACP90_09840 [Labrenzia sp. CP4]|nr:hypothetical protein ACP90_09840 [Labrenzia sp. CP4]